MPWKPRKRKCKQKTTGNPGSWAVVKIKDSSEEQVSCHTSKEKAESSIRAKHANENNLRLIIKQILVEKIQQEDFEDVMQTAQLAHLGQKRRDGSDYIMHPIAVQEITKKHYPRNFAAQILALLHDTVEDGPAQGHITEDELRQIIRGSITDPRDLQKIEVALDYMTHDKSIYPVYEDYLSHVFSNRLASIVKISDLIHNLSHNPSGRQIIKYRTALQNVPIPRYIKKSHLDELMGILDAHSNSGGLD